MLIDRWGIAVQVLLKSRFNGCHCGLRFGELVSKICNLCGSTLGMVAEAVRGMHSINKRVGRGALDKENPRKTGIRLISLIDPH
jgi:hypothetical protein